MLAPGEMCFGGMGAIERGFQVLAFAEMCFEGMGAVERGCQMLALSEMSFVGHGGSCKGDSRCWHWVKYVLWS